MPTVAEPIQWAQGAQEEDLNLEVIAPVVLPPGASWKELTVTIADDDIVIAKWKETKLFQWRFHDGIADVNWHAEDGKLVLELVKKEGSTWPALFKLPVPRNFPGLKSEAQLDALLRTEVEPLPPMKEDGDESDTAAAAAPKEVEAAAPAAASAEPDLDALLEETLEATVAKKEEEKPKKTQDKEAEEQQAAVKAEMDAFTEEITTMKAKLKEFQDEAEAETDEEKKANLVKRVGIVQKMIELTLEVRKIRSQTPTMANFARTQDADLYKSRINSGSPDEVETEAFLDDEETKLTPHEIFQHGVHFLRENNIAAALHFFRIGAIHHKHNLCVGLLHRLYSELKAPAKAAYFILNRANEPDLDASSNMVVAELFDRGVRHFPPLMACAVKYYQRAAMEGATSAMVSLAQTYVQGGCSGGLADEKIRDQNRSAELFQMWLNMAIERGNTDAYFIQSTLFISGEHGTPKSAANAARFFELAKKSNPTKMRRAAEFEKRIEQLRREEQPAATSAAPAAAASSGDSKPATPAGGSPTATSALSSGSAPPTARAAPNVVARPTGGRARGDAQPSAAGARPAGTHAGLKITKSSGGTVASAVAWRAFWEKSFKWMMRLYFVYCLAFPFRVIMLPQFYMVVATLREALGGGFSASQQRNGAMF